MNDQIYAVLMALEGDTLLLPNAAVIEVISRDTVRPVDGAPDWLIGNYEFNGRRVPVVSFEVLNGSPRPETARRSRVVLLHSAGKHLEAHAIGVLTQGYPHLVTLNRSAISATPLRHGDREDLVLSRVRIASQEAVIPDIETIEADLLRLDMAAASS
ncbi:MAG: chemotaxis protein CheW [Cupriavidus sp.]|nr:MAG: chemotaxis protein CheW [Cupriavidus sp.]